MDIWFGYLPAETALSRNDIFRDVARVALNCS